MNFLMACKLARDNYREINPTTKEEFMPDVNEVARIREAILIEALSDNRFRARNITTLMTMTATNVDECRGLLLEIGARGVTSRDGTERWGLISRLPASQPAPEPNESEEL